MKTLTRGGQNSIHSLRMNIAVVRFILKFFILTFLFFSLLKVTFSLEKADLKNAHDYYLAKVISLYQKDLSHKININRNGHSYNMSIGSLLNDSNLLKSRNKIKSNFIQSSNFALIASLLASLILIIIFLTKGRSLSGTRHIRGGSIVESKELKGLVKSYNSKELLLQNFNYRFQKSLLFLRIKKDIEKNKKVKLYKPYKVINNIEYPSQTETQHTLITGGSGTGKTQMLKHLLTQIKERGDRAIVYDKMGNFIPNFYDENKDIILNPFDDRSPAWSIFDEVEESIYFDSIASALMPLTKNVSDPFWTDAARTIFTSVASTLKERGETSNKKLLDSLLKIDLTDIVQLVKGTPAQAIIDERSPKTALSVMSVLSTYLSSMKYLKEPEDQISKDGEVKKCNTFSIRDWVKDDDKHNGSFLFIPSRGDQHESLKPLISAWIEIAINSLLSLKQNRNRRIWIILDELPSLHMLPSLNSGIAESRQFGGCFVLSLQLMAQLRSIYGKDDAETISGLAKTRVVFSSPDEDTARWCSGSLGRREQEEIKQNVSYGAHEVRDGVSLNKQTTIENIVIPTQIMNLDNLECYLKLPFNFPITKSKIKLHKSKEVAERFIRSNISLSKEEESQDNNLKEEAIEVNTDSKSVEDKSLNNFTKPWHSEEFNSREYLSSQEDISLSQKLTNNQESSINKKNKEENPIKNNGIKEFKKKKEGEANKEKSNNPSFFDDNLNDMI